MTRFKLFKSMSIAILTLLSVALLSTMVSAQTKLQGMIKGRSGAKIVLQTGDSPRVIVILTSSTDVAQVEGLLKVRKKEMSMAALIPGLPIQVEGTYDAQNQLVASKVRFKGNDLEQAQAIQAGLSETAQQAQKNKEDLEEHNAALTEQEKKIAANKAAIGANTARFGQLDDYSIKDEVIVYFGNGKVKVESKYTPQLVALAEKAKTIDGYMIEVKGFASASGSASLNQKLSEDRANNVAQILLQQGHIPLTNMLAPAAMGESRQVAADKKADSEAANRRVRVRVLQNKTVAGL